MTDARKVLTEADRALKQKPFLCGTELSLADISLACSLVYPIRAVMNENFLKPLAKLKDWFSRVSVLPEFANVWGATKLCKE